MAAPLEEILLEYQEAELTVGVPRRTGMMAVPGKATICVGPRRSGKSTLLFQRIRKLLDAGGPAR